MGDDVRAQNFRVEVDEHKLGGPRMRGEAAGLGRREMSLHFLPFGEGGLCDQQITIPRKVPQVRIISRVARVYETFPRR